jgi:hypothetical protein
MRMFVSAAVMSLALVGFVRAEEFTLTITSISDDGSMVTGNKVSLPPKFGKGGGFGIGEVVTVNIGKDVKVFKGKAHPDKKSILVADGDDLKFAGL